MLLRCCKVAVDTSDGTLSIDSSESGLVVTVANFPPVPSSNFLCPPPMPLQVSKQKPSTFLNKLLLHSKNFLLKFNHFYLNHHTIL